MKKNNLQGQVVRLETEKIHLENEIEKLKEEYRITCEQKNNYISTLEGSLGIAEEKYLRLNNIINELEKYLIERIEYNQGSELQDYLENTYSTIYSVLQELKGSGKE